MDTSAEIQTAPSLTGFMRAEVKRQKEKNQSGAKDYNSQPALSIVQQDRQDEVVNHGYSEEMMSGSGQQQQSVETENENNNEIGTGGGLPMRLPTEIMNTPPPESTENEYTQQQQETTDIVYNEDNEQNEQQEVTKNDENKTEKIKSLESEYAELDLEMAQQFYYLTAEQYKMGPFTMEEITEKYKNEDVNDETLIWSGNETNVDAKPLKQNERICSNLPRPPKRRQPRQKHEEHEVVASRSPSPTPPEQTEQTESKPPKKSGGCCIVM